MTRINLIFSFSTEIWHCEMVFQLWFGVSKKFKVTQEKENNLTGNWMLGLEMITLHMTKPQYGGLKRVPSYKKKYPKTPFSPKIISPSFPMCGMLSYIKCIFLLRGTEQGKASCTMWSDLLDSNFPLQSHQKLVGGLFGGSTLKIGSPHFGCPCFFLLNPP